MLSGARWVEETVAETMQLMVPVTIELRKVVLQADIRSPGGRKPMRRSYTYLPTPDAAMVGSEYAVQVHTENVLERRQVEEEFEQAKMEQRRISARQRDRARRERNREEHGMARKPAAPRKPTLQLATPVTADAHADAKGGVRACGTDIPALDGDVERALSWEEC